MNLTGKCKSCGQTLPVADQMDLCSPLKIKPLEPPATNEEIATALASEWRQFQPTVPLEYVIESIRTARNK